VLSHARALLTGVPSGATDYIDADPREQDEIVRAAAQTAGTAVYGGVARKA
jgi:hypothetical protein